MREKDNIDNFTGVAAVPGPVPGTRMTEQYVREIGRMAYLWAWPMVNLHNRLVAFERVPEPGLMGGAMPCGPLNQIGMPHDYITPDQKFVVCPNQDVVYGFGILSLDQEPAIVQVPDFGDRFWVFQLGDQRTEGFGELGKMYGSEPGFYLLVGPDWEDTPPDGIQAVSRSPTKIGYLIPRIFMDDTAEDREAIQPLVDQIMAYPLSQFTGETKTKDWAQVPSFPAGQRSGDQEIQWVDPDAFFDKSNIFVNKPLETSYFYQDLDSAGERLNGSRRYTVTFAEGELPPVKGFWSLTLYNEHHFFHPNELKRFSLGTKTKNLWFEEDGSLTLYAQSQPPEEGVRSNWLPSSEGDFSLYLRAYWPEDAVLDGRWSLPAVIPSDRQMT